MSVRLRPFVVVAAVATVVAVVVVSLGPARAWKIWNIPAMVPHFADVRTITHGAETRARGLDPQVENPADPWGRTMNYPRVWQRLYALGVDERHTTLLGGLFIVTFLVGLALSLDPTDPAGHAAVALGMLSPATMLAVERGNNDLLMVGLVGVAIACATRWRAASVAALVGGLVLKLYPLFALALAAGWSRAARWRALAAVAVATLTYAWFNALDLVRIRAGTPQGDLYSYGIGVASAHAPWTVGTERVVAALVAAALVVTFIGRDPDTADDGDERTLLAFRAGAGVYVGTFILGANWDYRLVFLLLGLPQLVRWIRSAGSSTLKWLAVCTAVCASWALGARWVDAGSSVTIWFWGEQGAKWGTFVGMASLLVLTLPSSWSVGKVFGESVYRPSVR